VTHALRLPYNHAFPERLHDPLAALLDQVLADLDASAEEPTGATRVEIRAGVVQFRTQDGGLSDVGLPLMSASLTLSQFMGEPPICFTP
jgi:hypothetical protein